MSFYNLWVRFEITEDHEKQPGSKLHYWTGIPYMEFEEKNVMREDEHFTEAIFVQMWINGQEQNVRDQFKIPIRTMIVGSNFKRL